MCFVIHEAGHAPGAVLQPSRARYFIRGSVSTVLGNSRRAGLNGLVERIGNSGSRGE